MIALSERTRIAFDRLPEGAKSRFHQIVRELDESRVPRLNDKKMQRADFWIARLDDNFRLIYRPTTTGVFIEDVLDKNRYSA